MWTACLCRTDTSRVSLFGDAEHPNIAREPTRVAPFVVCCVDLVRMSVDISVIVHLSASY